MDVGIVVLMRRRFAAEVRASDFPTHEHGFAMSREVIAALETATTNQSPIQ